MNVENNTKPVVLVAEDRRATRLMIRNVLQNEGYQVIEAENGEEALEIYNTMPPDIVLMDIIMPVMDGLSACHQIQKVPGGKGTPILILSGLDDEKYVEQAFQAGATDFIAKPVNWIELKHRVRRLLYLKEMQETVYYQAYYDDLTGLPNRLLFKDRLSIALGQAQKENSQLAVLYLNLRNFKLFNDAFGYEKGDQLIKLVAHRLEGAVGEGITVARLMGDDFALMLQGDIQEDEVARSADHYLRVINQPWIIDGQEIIINCNVGISCYPNDGDDPQNLLKNAETAMFRAAEQSSNIYRFFNQQMNTKALERLTLENHLLHAMEKNEFRVFYQPLVDIRSGKINGIEALLRWQHKEKGLIPPLEFIPLAEETGLIVPIGEWVLRTACYQAREWQKKGFTPLKVGVNLSALQFQQEDLAQTITGILEETGLEPDNLKLEITESLAMQDVEFTIRILRKLKGMGIKASIDDFGTGYSSLNYLKKFPIEELKIDRSFVMDILSTPDDAAIVKTIILLGKSLNLKVTAEGVETKAHLDFLRAKGCDLAQGYYFSKPLPADEIEGILGQKYDF